MSMKTTKAKLMETINAEINRFRVEDYLRKEITQVLTEDDKSSLDVKKIENLLQQSLKTLDSIDLSIDYLAAALTGQSVQSIGIAQKIAGRGMALPVHQSGRPPIPSKMPQQSLDELNPHKTLDQHEPEDFDEPEEDPDALRADTVLGGGAGEWQASKDALPKPMRPPQEYRRQAIEILATFNVHVGQQAIDILAWELYNSAMEGPTQAMGAPETKPSFFKKLLRKVVSEELDKYLDEEKTNVSKDGQKRVSDKIAHLIDKEGKDQDQAAAIAYSMEERGEL